MLIKKYDKLFFLLNSLLLVCTLGLKFVFGAPLFPCGLQEVFALVAGGCVVGIGSKKKSWWNIGLQIEWGMVLLFLLFSEWFADKIWHWFLLGLLPSFVLICFAWVKRKPFLILSKKKIDVSKTEKIIRLLVYPIALLFVLVRELPDILGAGKIDLGDIISLFLSSFLLAILLYIFALSILRQDEHRR